MGMLDRYRKSGGFIQLLTLIETSPEAKQEKFLNLIKEESQAWETELRRRRLSFEKISGWEQSFLMEIAPRIPEKIIAVALYPLAPEKREGFLKSLTHIQRRVVEEFINGTPPAPGEIFSCQSKIVQEVRTMGQQGHLKLDKIDPDLTVPDGIEEKLNNSFSGLSSLRTTATVSEAASKVASTATAPSAAATAAVVNESIPSAIMEEVKELRRRMQQMQQMFEQMERENKTLKDKLEQIRKIA